jgi:uncharacterized iron-regulated membrane protein
MGANLRKLLFWSHLTLGLVAGLLILALCVTGTLMTYERQIQTLADRWGVASRRPAADARPLALESVIQRVRAAKGIDPESLTVFAGENRPVEVYFSKKSGSVYVDAYTGAIIGAPAARTAAFFKTIRGWHRWLGADGSARPGFRAVVNAANFVFLFLTILGLYLWIPRRWTWQHVRAVLLLRSVKTGHARDFNWHNAIGIWAAIPLIIMIWTGMAMHYPWAKRWTYQAAGTPLQVKAAAVADDAQDEDAPPPTDARFAALDPLLSRAEVQAPGWKAIRLTIPESAEEPVKFTIDMSGYGAVGQSADLKLDRSGAVVRYKAAGSDGVTAKNFIRYGHTGELWGAAGQTLMGTASLGGGFLVYTGIALSLRRYTRWRSRKGRHERRRERAAATTAQAA